MQKRVFTGLQAGLNKLLADDRKPPPETRIGLPGWLQLTKVLIVDNYRARRLSLHQNLEAEGIVTVHSGNFVNSLSTLGGRNFDVIYVCSDSLRVGELQKVTDSASFSNSFKPFVIALVIDPTVKKLVCVKHQGAQGYLCPPFDGRRLLSKFTYVKNLRQA